MVLLNKTLYFFMVVESLSLLLKTSTAGSTASSYVATFTAITVNGTF